MKGIELGGHWVALDLLNATGEIVASSNFDPCHPESFLVKAGENEFDLNVCNKDGMVIPPIESEAQTASAKVDFVIHEKGFFANYELSCSNTSGFFKKAAWIVDLKVETSQGTFSPDGMSQSISALEHYLLLKGGTIHVSLEEKTHKFLAAEMIISGNTVKFLPKECIFNKFK